VIDGDRAVGSLTEVALVKSLHDGADPAVTRVADVMGSPLPEVDESVDVAEPYRLLLGGHNGVLVTRDGAPVGLITRYDLLDFWTAGREREQVGA
jgi:predicted transcriptional regulator